MCSAHGILAFFQKASLLYDLLVSYDINQLFCEQYMSPFSDELFLVS
jgi:hypothetical protein